MFATTILGVTLSAVWWMMLVVLSVFIAIWPALMARTKGYNFWLFFFLSIFFWWAMFFVVLFLPNRNSPPAATA